MGGKAEVKLDQIVSCEYSDDNNPLSRIFAFWQENAQKIAEFLAAHPRVKKVNYAGLPGHPGRDLHYSQVCLMLDLASILTSFLQHETFYIRKPFY